MILVTQGPNAEARQQVESLRVQTPKYGEQRLDVDPDKRLVSGTSCDACALWPATCLCMCHHIIMLLELHKEALETLL